MKDDIVQLVKAIEELTKEDLKTLMQHKENQEYIKGVLRDSPLEEEAVKTRIMLLSRMAEELENEAAQGVMILTEEDEKWLRQSKDQLREFRIDHKMEERY